ncbi:MAG: integrase, partial [Paracoccaceae bacterium]
MGKERRNQIWHYRKRTPKRFRDIEPRAMIYLSLHTTSEALADQKIPDVEAGLFAFWEAKAAGKAKNAQASYDATVRLARSRGYRYVAADDLASDIPELVRRMSRLMREFPDPGNVPPEIANADLGGVERPKLMLSDLLEEFQDLTRDQVIGKSADQMRRWRNPRKKAIENLTRVIGDKPLLDITREDALEFRRWLWARIDREGLSPGSVNKDLTHISAMVRTVSDMKSLGIETPFNGLAFREKEKPRRRAFTVDWIRDNLACADPLAEMNYEARDVLLAMVNTGCRPS